MSAPLLATVLLAVAFEPEPEPVPSRTCAMCHAQPAKRLADSKHGFILDPEIGGETSKGCETCHGPGLDHVLSDGDKTKIVNPRKLAANPLDAICQSCHADVVLMRDSGSGVHATKQSCSSCHVVHNPAPGGDRRITEGGRSLGNVEDSPLARRAQEILEAAREPLGLRSLEASGRDFGLGMLFSGSLTAGLRFVDISGDESQYDQDVNLDGGFRLLDAELRGIAPGPDAIADRFEAHASGIDDPVSSYTLSLEKDRRFSSSSGFRKQTWVYNSSGDYHQPFDVKREQTFTDLSVDLRENVRVYAGYDKLRRSGEYTNTQFVDGVVFPVQAPVDQRSQLFRIGALVDFGAFDASLEEQLRWYDVDDRRLLLRQNGPSQDLYFFRNDRKDFTPTTIFRVHSAPKDGKVDVSVRGLYSQTKGRGDVDSERSLATDPSGPNADTYVGDTDVRRNHRAIETALTLAVRDDLSISTTAAAADVHERGHVRLEREATPGGPPVPFRDDSTSVSRRLVKGSAEALYLPLRSLSVRAGYEGELEDVRIEGQDDSQTIDSGGPIVGVQAHPWDRLSIDVLYRRTDTDDPFTVAGFESRDRLRTRLRWRPTDGVYVSPEWTRSTGRNEDSDTHVDSDAVGLVVGTDGTRDLSGSASYFYRSYSSRTESNFTENGVRIDEGVGFSNREHRVLVDGEWCLTKPFRLQADFEAVISDGDSPFLYERGAIRPTYDFSSSFSGFVEMSYARFDETGSSVDDYDAFIYLIGATYRF